MTIPESMITHSTLQEFHHRHRMNRPERREPRGPSTHAPLRGLRRGASRFLRALAEHIEPGPAGTPGAHRA